MIPTSLPSVHPTFDSYRGYKLRARNPVAFHPWHSNVRCPVATKQEAPVRVVVVVVARAESSRRKTWSRQT